VQRGQSSLKRHIAPRNSAGAGSFGQIVALADMTLRRTQPLRHIRGNHMATNAGVLDTQVFADLPADIERRLWQAVIVTTIQEWISGPLRSKRQAEEYLFQDQKDFPAVCQSAGMDAGRLRAKLNRLLRQNPALAASAHFLNR
jgi:hypothetical protein